MLVLVHAAKDVPLGRDEANGLVSDLISRYDENTEVAEHGRRCFCVGQAAKQRGRDAVLASLQAQFPNVASSATIPEEVPIPTEAEMMLETMPKPAPATLRDYLRAECDRLAPMPPCTEEESHAAWKALCETMYEAPLRAVMATFTDGEAPDPECEDCHGTGTEMTTSNPEGYWDWWTIGGRWSGCLTGVSPEDNLENWETCFLCKGTGKRNDALGKEERKKDPAYGCNGCNGTGKSMKFSLVDYDGDIVPVALLDREKAVESCYGYVDPEGEWHAQGEMGWFGMERSQERTKEELVVALHGALDVYADCYAVIVDCHV